MKVLVLGSGLMGPAAAFNALSDPDVSQVIIADISQRQLAQTMVKLTNLGMKDRLTTSVVDARNLTELVPLVANVDVVVGTLPTPLCRFGVLAAAEANVPLIDLTRPLDEELPELQAAVEQTGSLTVLGCGVKPGLTEMTARHLASQLDSVDEVHIHCGGIPEEPAPPLGYKIVFGGQSLPLRESDVYVLQDGALRLVPRYSGIERVFFDGVGECEVWHEGFMPWLLELPMLRNLRSGTQKTVRWPGYAEKVTVLKELGLLRQSAVDVDGVSVIPKRLVDTLLYPHVKLDPDRGDRDITVIRVEVLGTRDGHPWRLCADMVDRYDATTGFTSMARTAGFTGAIVARMVARHEVIGKGLLTPEQLIWGAPFVAVLNQLASVNVRLRLTTERTEDLSTSGRLETKGLV